MLTARVRFGVLLDGSLENAEAKGHPRACPKATKLTEDLKFQT